MSLRAPEPKESRQVISNRASISIRNEGTPAINGPVWSRSLTGVGKKSDSALSEKFKKKYEMILFKGREHNTLVHIHVNNSQ